MNASDSTSDLTRLPSCEHEGPVPKPSEGPVPKPPEGPVPEPSEGSVPEPSGLGLPRRANLTPFAQEILPGMEDFVAIPEGQPSDEAPVADTPGTGPAPFWNARVNTVFAVALALGAILGSAIAILVMPQGLSPSSAVMSSSAGGLSPETPSAEDAKPSEPDGIPADLLGNSSDAACWEVAKNMRGEIGGVALAFHRGHAAADGTDYRIVLEFARDGEDVLVKVAGNGLWAVRVDADGKIRRAYRWPRADRPLKSIIE